MKRPTFFHLIVIITLTILFTAACGGNRATQAPENPPAPTTSNEGAGGQEPADSETGSEETAPEETGNTESGGEETGSESTNGEESSTGDGPTIDERGVPSDVPVLDAAYELRSEANNSRVIYKIDGTIQEVVDYYIAELPAFGWNKVLGADSAFGAMGTLSRQNDPGDNLSILLSFNPNGNFVVVTIDIIRAR